MDERLLDLPLSIPFMRLILGEELHTELSSALQHISVIDPEIGRSLSYLYDHSDNADIIDSMGLTFVLIGHASYPLCENGEELVVSSENVLEYLTLTVKAFLHTTISKQVEAFQNGYFSIAPRHTLTTLSLSDWIQLLCDPTKEMWPGGYNEIKSCMICDHGYTIDSQAIQWLIDIMVEMTPMEQKLFVRFVTGSHRLPLGGLSKLEPALTVVRKLTSDEANIPNDTILPSASTCTNYLKLPNYTTKEIMRQKLHYCIQEGQLSFHLS